MTHQESRQRRAEMASRVSAGASIGGVAKEFGVSSVSVREACQEHNVKWDRCYHVHSFEVLAELRNGRTLQAIADDINLTRQRVHQIKNKAVEFGVLDWVDRRLNV